MMQCLKRNVMEAISKFWAWYKTTAFSLGIPVLFIVLWMAVKMLAFTLTCYTAGYQCERAFGGEQALIDYMGGLLDANKGMDIVTAPRLKSR